MDLVPASRSPVRRLMASMWRQREHLVPETHHAVPGQRALVTGGNGGIGFETARGLLQRGAEVVLACRRPDRAEAAAQALREATGGAVSWVACDLADLASVADAARTVGDRRFDIVVCNAGITAARYGTTVQGHELTFGVNVLGHVLLVQALLDSGAVTAGSRVVWVSGDIYVLARDATPDFAFRTLWGGQLAYNRSKLGSLWMRHAFAQHYPEVAWYAVHPGVVQTHLITQWDYPSWLARWLGMITPTQGSWTSVTCATDPDLAEGYHHNTLGFVHLHPRDVGADVTRANALRERCLQLVAPFREAPSDAPPVAV